MFNLMIEGESDFDTKIQIVLNKCFFKPVLLYFITQAEKRLCFSINSDFISKDKNY